MNEDKERFEAGDVLAIRGHRYEVEQADVMPDGGVLQYRLKATGNAPPAHLKPHEDGFTVVMYYNAEPTVIE